MQLSAQAPAYLSHYVGTKIEMMLKREMDAPEFDREKVKQGIMSIADPGKSEIMRCQQEDEALAKENTTLKAICAKYNDSMPSVVDLILNRYIKEIVKEPSESVPILAIKEPAKPAMKQKMRSLTI